MTGSINNGPLVNDVTDFYAVPLLAGQTIAVQVTSPLTPASGVPSASTGVAVQVYDPDGRIVASDFSNVAFNAVANRSFNVHATVPGLYRVAIVPISGLRKPNVTRPYTLSVQKLGGLSIGGIVSSGDAYFANTAMGVQATQGDLGALLVGGDIYGAESVDPNQPINITPATPITAKTGNIRSIDASQISHPVGGGQSYPEIVAGGSIGQIRGRTGYVYFNPDLTNTTTARPSTAATIGGDYQVIEAAGDFAATLSANGGIGVIRAGSISTNPTLAFPGYYEVNADNAGNDGTIGLIDTPGDLGNFATGGPAIFAGAGSNIRYLHVGGLAYRDQFFGSGQTTVTATTDQPVTLRDDSGASVRITPIASQTSTSSTNGGTPFGSSPNQPNSPIGSNPLQPSDPLGRPTTTPTTPLPTPVTTAQGNLEVSAYPVRSGGQIIYRVQSSTGVQIETTGVAANSAADIGTIYTGSGTQLITQVASASTVVAPSLKNPQVLGAGQTLEVLLTGARTNVYEIAPIPTSQGTDVNSPTTPGTPANYTSIINSTDGEIINLTANDVGRIEADYLGVGRPAAGVPLLKLRDVTGFEATYPLNKQKTAIAVNNAIDVIARGPIGNVLATGTISLLAANADGKNTKRVLEGIVGPVVATGDIGRVDVGEGLATSGTGNVSLAGVYSRGSIGRVTNSNGGGDIRGEIISAQYIEGIQLTGTGSIIDADILQATNRPLVDVFGAQQTSFAVGLETVTYLVDTAGGSSLNGVGDISIDGNGGIIGSEVVGENLGLTTVSPSGFGVIANNFLAAGSGTMKGLRAGGLGIRSTDYQGGAFIGNVVATGNGKVLDLKKFPQSVLQGGTVSYDASTGIAPNFANDLYRYFGTTSKKSKIPSKTIAGLFADSTIAASRSVGTISVYEFRSFAAGSLSAQDETFFTSINFGDTIGAIVAKRDINGLRVVGGKVGTISAGGSIANFQLQTTGTVKSIAVKKFVRLSANFNVTTEGGIDSITVGRNMDGTVYAARGIGKINVGGDLSSPRASGGIVSGQGIKSIVVGGSVLNGTYVKAAKTIDSLTVAGDLAAGSTIQAAKFGKTSILGSKAGSLLTA